MGAYNDKPEEIKRYQKAMRVLDAVEETADGTVRDLVGNVLKALGYDGLHNRDGECGCGTDDLMPCENSIAGLGDCRPAYRLDCYRCSKWADDCDVCDSEWDELFSEDKDRCEPDYMEVS